MRAYLRETIVIPCVLNQASTNVDLKIMQLSNGYWLDFNDSTFKASGWTDDTGDMTSDDNYVWTYTWTTPESHEKYQVVFVDVDTGFNLTGPIIEVSGGTVFTVQTDAGNTATTFKTDLTPSVDNYYRAPSLVKMLSGNLIGQTRKVENTQNSPYVGATKFIKLAEALTASPTAGNVVVVINE